MKIQQTDRQLMQIEKIYTTFDYYVHSQLDNYIKDRWKEQQKYIKYGQKDTFRQKRQILYIIPII